jgi:hypothetical protein
VDHGPDVVCTEETFVSRRVGPKPGYQIIRLIGNTLVEDAATIDHGLHRLRALGAAEPVSRFALVDQELKQTRAVGHGGKAWWAIKCRCMDGQYFCEVCLGTKIAMGEPA